MNNPRRPIRRYALSFAFAAAAYAIAVAPLSHTSAQAPVSPAAATTQAARDSAAPTVTAPGSVAAFYMTELYAKDSGYISDVKADIGDHVKKGDVLAQIDDPELQQQLASMEAMLAAKEETAKAAGAAVAQAQAATEVAKKQFAGLEAERKLVLVTLARQEALFTEKAVTNQQIDEMRAKGEVAAAAADVGQAKITSAEADLHAAEANQAVAAAQVRVAKAEAERTRILVGYMKILAPFDGVVTRRLVNPGDLVQAATASRTTPLFTCQKLDVVRVFCEVPESSVAGIRPGVRADVRLMGQAGQVFKGTVTRMATSIDPASRTMRAEIDLPNPDDGLRPGMYAQVTLSPDNQARPATTAPQSPR